MIVHIKSTPYVQDLLASVVVVSVGGHKDEKVLRQTTLTLHLGAGALAKNTMH